MSCRPDANDSIRGLLGKQNPASNGELVPRKTQIWLWQVGIVYLMWSVVFMIAGMLMLVWTAAGGENWWNGQAQLAIAFTIVACLVGALFAWEQVALFSSDGRQRSDNRGVRLS
jgi:hypothetical protein